MVTQIQKEWMDERNRVSPLYREGVKKFIDLAKANVSEGSSTCSCPCKKCRNRARLIFEEVQQHLVANGIDPSYRVWSLHGDNALRNPNEYPTEKVAEKILVEESEGIGMRNLVDDSYEVHNVVEGDASMGGDGQTSDTNEPYNHEPDMGKRYNEYRKQSQEKLYPSSEGTETTLSAIVELHNLKKQFGWSGTSVTALLVVLKKWLPKGNTLPDKYPKMKAMLKDLGMKATCIDACVNNCLLYWKQYKDAIECPQCKFPRYKVKAGKSGKIRSKEPNKVLRHFPLIPRLKRLYTIPWIAHEMTWHDRAKHSRDYMRHPADSGAWKLCKDKWKDFSEEGRNVWLGIATDGFNPRGVQSSAYSCWPVITVPYNLPPSLCMKSEFQMLSLLIPGPKAPGQNIDVFLEPLVDELKLLWEEGVLAYDMHKKEHFTLKAILMWGIHDFPAYGNLSGCITHGYKECPVCGDNTPAMRLPSGRKIVHMDFRMFLRMGHPFRVGKYLGLKKHEDRTPPQRLNGQTLLKKLNHIHYIPGKHPRVPGIKHKRVELSEDEDTDDDDDDDDDDGDKATKAWYKKSILFGLEYWIHHQIRHAIDVMHVEKNVAEHIINTILDKKDKTKDSVSAREDLKKMGIHSSQWMQTDKSTGKQVKPVAPFLLGKEEKNHFCQILKDLKLPSGFSSNLSNIVTLQPPGLHALKSHDYHVIIEYLLPVLLQHAFPKYRDLRRALHQISLFFNLLCSKVIIREEVQEAKYMVAEALCMLEKYFPPSFFDISIHLMVHLADEALICGPVRQRWMYPFERAMKECKDIPSNKRYVEGSIAEAYLVSESVRYAMEYMPNSQDGNHKATREYFLDENEECSDEGPLLDDNTVTILPQQFIQIRRWVLFRLEVDKLGEYYAEYRSSLESTSHGKGKIISKKEVEIQTEFIVWLYDKLLKAGETNSYLWRLVKGPLHQAKTYKKYRANGFIFSTVAHDDTVATQDSGVCMSAVTTFVSSRKDKNPIDASVMYYGRIQEILELNYIDFKEVIFYCDWVRVEDKSNGCKICPDSNLVVVNFNKLKSVTSMLDEPVILASDANQVFYSKDLKNPDWWVVIHSPRRLTSLVDEINVPEVFQSTLADQPNLRPLLVPYS